MGAARAKASAIPLRPTEAASPAPVWAIALLLVLGIAAYANSFSGALVFDDFLAIRDNPTIRTLWPPGQALTPPVNGETVSGRPILNLSFAVNYALDGANLAGFHALNLAIHLGAALLLFGIIRRILEKMRLMREPVWIAFAAALLWTLHPLQTEAVTYLVQRAESLMGFFYLLTVYSFIRYAESREARGWAFLAFGACLAGMGTKEVMVSAPIMVLLCDRAFWAGSFAQAWRLRSRFYLSLAATWILLAYEVALTHGRGGTSGFGSGVSVLGYWASQGPAVLHYLRLFVWPNPLIFDYGLDRSLIAHPSAALPSLIVVALLAVVSLVALWGNQALGFLGFWFFAILAPTSLIPGNRQMIAEQRMYLALAALAILVVVGGAALLSRRSASWVRPFLVIVCLASCVGGVLTWRRNADYSNPMILMQKNLQDLPGNAYAEDDLGYVLDHSGHSAEAIDLYEEAVRLAPDVEWFQKDLASSLRNANRTAEAVPHYRDWIALDPKNAGAHNDLAVLLAVEGKLPEAISEYEEAIRLKPDNAEAESNLGNALLALGKPDQAVPHYEAGLRLQPNSPAIELNLGYALTGLGKAGEAVTHFDRALRLDPSSAPAMNGLGLALLKLGRPTEAAAQFENLVRLKPDIAEAHRNLARALQALGKTEEAQAEMAKALALGQGHKP